MNLVKIVGPLLMATTLLSGCATLPKSATPYTPDTTATPGTATIYLYRSGGFVGGALSPNIAANGVPLADLPAGGYFIYHALPGEVEFSAHTEAKTSVTIDAKGQCGLLFQLGKLGAGTHRIVRVYGRSRNS